MSACGPTLSQELFARAERASVPLNMMLELTYRCNESCIHCYLPETQGARDPRPQDELSAEEWGRALEEMAGAGTLYLTLTGGEVLLREDFPRILEIARGLSFAVDIYTNATLLTPEMADLWAALEVHGVGVSCYSPEAAWHDRVTRLPGSFERTMRGVRLLRERGIQVKLKTPLMKWNLDSAGALMALAGELGVGYQFDPMLAPRNDGVTTPQRLALGVAGLRKAYQDQALIAPELVSGAGRLRPREPTCSAGRTSGAVNPFGVVFPCIQWMAPAGNVRLQPFARIWREGAVLLKARSYTGQDVKPCPDCGGRHVVHCLGLSQLERGDPLVPDSNACRLTKAVQEIQQGGGVPA